MTRPDAPPLNLRALLVLFVVIALMLYPLAQSLRQTYQPDLLLGMSSAFWAGVCYALSGMSVIAAGRTVIGLLRGEGKPGR